MRSLAIVLSIGLAAATGSGCIFHRHHAAAPAPAKPPATATASAAAAPAVVAPQTVVDISAELAPIAAAGKLPALAAAAWKNGELLAIGATGVRKIDDADHLATVDDQWHLGSDTKAMTATLIGIYVDRGVLRWSDTLAILFPGDKVDPGYANVSLDQLLQHRGGAPGDPPMAAWNKMRNDGAAPIARAHFVSTVLSMPPAQAPGTYVYSNAGYMIAAAALEHATKKTWELLMLDDLFTPLRMTSCGFGPPGTAAVDQPWGHTADGAAISPDAPTADNPAAIGPAGTVHCSLVDWGRFLSVHASAKQTLVSAATMTHLHTAPTGGDYMGGWMITSRPWAGGLALTHSGSNTMWYVTAWLAPGKGLAFAAVTNRGDAAKDLDHAFAPLVKRFAQ